MRNKHNDARGSARRDQRERRAGLRLNPGLVRTAISEDGLSCSEPGTEQLFHHWFDSGAEIPSEHAGELVVYLATAEADTLSGRYLDVHDGCCLPVPAGLLA